MSSAVTGYAGGVGPTCVEMCSELGREWLCGMSTLTTVPACVESELRAWPCVAVRDVVADYCPGFPNCACLRRQSE